MGFVMLQDATATTDGVWGAAKNTKSFSVHVKGIGTGGATVVLNGSNVFEKPADADHEIELARATADAYLVVQAPTRWAKLRISTFSTAGGSISTHIQGSFDG